MLLQEVLQGIDFSAVDAHVSLVYGVVRLRRVLGLLNVVVANVSGHVPLVSS